MTTRPVDPSLLPFLTGGGEMGARMRDLEWSRTALGPPEGWPQSLRAIVSVLLASKAPIVLFWGPEFNVLYNDAYRPVCAGRHPDALGRPGREAWSDSWDTQIGLHALLDGVVRTGEAFRARDFLFVLERGGLVEDTYFDVSCDPVRTEAGTVGGVFCHVSETTERVVSERRLALLRELAAPKATAQTERDACVLAIETLSGKPDVAFALAYLGDELQAATPGARQQFAEAEPELVRTLVLPSPAGRRGGQLIVGINPRRPFDENYRGFLELVAGQLVASLANARDRETERQAAEAPAVDPAETTSVGDISREFRSPLLNHAPLGVYVIDADFRIIDVNPLARRMFADVAAGVINRSFDEVVRLQWPKDVADEMSGIFRRTLATGEPHVATDGGGWRIDRRAFEYYEWRVDRITLPDGRFGLVCYFRDISQQKQEAAAQAYLAAVVDSADDAIIAKDLGGIIRSCNRAAERLFGYSSEELIGQPVHILIPPERHSEENEILARLRQGERIEHFETVRVTKDGRRIDLSLTISPVRDKSGRIIGASKIGRDITALKQAEAERIRLIEENAAVTETLNNVGAIVASDLDRDKVVQAVTDAATQRTGAEFGAFFYNVVDQNGEAYTLYTISGVPREQFSKFPMPRNTEVFAPTFKGIGVVRSDDITQDRRYGHNAPYYGMPPGHLPVRSYLAVPVKGRRGEVIGGLFFGHSAAGRFTTHHERIAVGIAAWASVALENASLYMTVQEASRIKDEFLASLSHELRTPLNAILGYARMLRAGIIAPDRKDNAIDTIERNATSLTQIVEDVLDISRIVAGKIRLNVQPVDFPTIVRNAIDVIAPAAEAKGVRIETIIDPEAAPISGDPERLQQVLWNLLSNAVKFTNRGGKAQVRLERVNSHIELTVSDTGIGIPPEFLPHVFERFRQADAGFTRERGGLGLGLSIARQLTEMHGGTIDVASAGTGHGATFRIKIPLMIAHRLRDDSPRVHPRSQSTAAVVDAPSLRGVHVLAVDDEPDAVAMVCEILESRGARVTPARSAEDALAKLAAEPPDVIVADLGMPHVDGFAFIERLRRHEDARLRQVPAAALTAYARSEDRMKALQAGFQIHLAKPIDPVELVTTIASLAKQVVKNPESWRDSSMT